jgi:hypothetical protein
MMVRAATLIAAVAVLAAGASPDGAAIVNSGSTNSSGYTIKLWSNGNARLQMNNGGAPTAFTVPPETAATFFRDLAAARADGAQLQHCMKSVSFGYSLTVQWHGWTSPDFTCPPLAPPVQTLFQDSEEIEAAAHVQNSGPPHLIRKPLPNDMRKTSTPTPEAEAT